jgi:hypothetical protein
VRVSLKSVSGVDSVDVSLAKGLAAVKMKPGNTATLTQLRTAITKNGFTMKRSTLIVSGTVVVADGKPQLKVSGSNEMLDLTAEADVALAALSLNGKSVVVTGEIPETAKGKSFAIQYRSITEQ